MSNDELKSTSGQEEGPRSRRSLLYASAILLVLMLIMSATAHLVGMRPAALVGFPVMIIGATTLVLILLYLVGPKPETQIANPVKLTLRAALMPAVAVDAQTGRVLAANDDAAVLIGSARLTIGNHISDVFVDGLREKCHDLLDEVAERGEAELNACSIRTRAGEPKVVHVIARHQQVGDEAFVLVGMYGNDTNDSVAQFARVQERLMSNISHELRTPLNVVMGFSELLTTGTLGEMPDNQLDAAEECHEGGERMLRLINDILDVGRTRSYYMAGDIRLIAPGEMIDRVENLLSGQARREDLELDVDIPDQLPTLETDEKAFKQLTYHLILSSLDRSEPGAAVRVSASSSAENKLVIRVTDSGPEYTRPIVPEPFETVPEDDADDNLAPPLLGIPLCATLAERIGASLTTCADSDGTHFVVEISFVG